MKFNGNAIEELTRQLQDQREVPLWIVASGATIFAIAGDEAECYGPRGRWFYKLFNNLGLSLAASLALILIGSVITSVWWIRCLTVTRSKQDAEELFIGFGAGPERQMAEQFRLESDFPVAHLDQTDPRSLALVAVPGLLKLLTNCCRDAWTLVKSLRAARTPFIKDNAKRWLVSAAIRFCDYVFVKSWIEALSGRGRRIVFISADIPAFAAMDARNSDGFKIEFRQHGLLSKGIIFPQFSRVIALNRHEAAYLKSRIPAAEVESLESSWSENYEREHAPVLLLASIYDNGAFKKHEHLQVLRNIFSWAAKLGLQVIVRTHPAETGNFWQRHFPEIAHDETAGGFKDALQRYKPLFVFSWWSTSLIDALREGIAPILIIAGSKSALEKLVFPLHNVTFQWDNDESLLRGMAADPVKYRDGIMNLMQFV